MKAIYRLGIITYAVLLILAIVFYKERSFFVDIAYHLFFILKDGKFAIQNFRFGAILTQIFPLLAGKLGLPLGATAAIYSAGFIIYYFTCYLICGALLKQYKYAIVILLINILFVSDTFYWIQSELPQGLVFMVTMFAVIANRRLEMRPVVYAIVYFMVFTVAFFHPLIIFPFAYAVIFLLISKDDKPANKLLYAVSFFFLLIFLLKKVVFSTTYDSAAMLGLDNFSTRFPYVRMYSNKHFALYSFSHFYWLTILSITIMIFYIAIKKWGKAILFIGFYAGYLLLINVSFPDRSTAAFYIENLYLPLALFVAFPFVFDLLPYLSIKKLALPIMILIAVTGVIRIYLSHQPYTVRLNWERKFLAQHANDKLVVDAVKTPADTLMMTWGTPYEFWLLSTIETGKTASVVIAEHPEQTRDAINSKNDFVTIWGAFPYTSFPVKYFHFTDTTTKYTVIK